MTKIAGRDPRYINWKPRIETRQRLMREVENGRPCALCGQPIDLSLPQFYIDPTDGKRKRAPWSFEVDEIVPISLGGLPYGDNCQPAHRLCNQRAGNKTRRQKAAKPIPDPMLKISGKNAEKW